METQSLPASRLANRIDYSVCCIFFGLNVVHEHIVELIVQALLFCKYTASN